MVDPYDPKRRQVEDFITRYVCLMAVLCFASAILFVGWPALLTWAAVYYGVKVYREVMFGSGAPPTPNKPKRKAACRK